MQSRVDRQIRALALAQQCAAHGARVRTISRITGMNPRDLLRLSIGLEDAGELLADLRAALG